MPIIKMDTELALMLEQAYLLASKKVEGAGIRLGPILRRLPEDIFNMPSGQLDSMDELAGWLRTDGEEIRWRREWMEKSDLMAGGHSFIGEPNPAYKNYSLNQIIRLLQDFTELSREEFSALLFELTRATVTNPELAAIAIKELGLEQYEQMFAYIYRDLGAQLLMRDELTGDQLNERISEHLLPLSILTASASWANGGLDSDIQNFFLPREGSQNASLNLRYLGMILGTAKFAPSFLASAGIYMLNKSNRQNVLSALNNNQLKLNRPLHKQPYRKLTNPGEAAFRQLGEHPEGYLEFLTHPRLAALKLDVDTFFSHQIDFQPIFSKAMSSLAEDVLNNPEIYSRVKPALPSIGAFIYQNQGQLGGSQNFYVSTAKIVSLFIPDLRKMATEATFPLLAPIVQDPEAMAIFSGSLGIFTLRHLNQALEAEFDSSMTSEEKQRTVSAHIDAVSDVYYHTFTAMAAPEKKVETSISILSSGLAFVSRSLQQVLRVNLGVSPQLALYAAVYANQKIRDYILENAEVQSARTTPKELFTRQIINRDFGAGLNGSYPEPTWFELELANKILQENPPARKDLEIGKWFNGKEISPPVSAGQDGGLATSRNTARDYELQDFSEWFSNKVNADPPTDFSKSFLHIQRKFGRDLLLDALSIEIDSIKRDAKSAKKTAERALLNYELYDYELYAAESSGSRYE